MRAHVRTIASRHASGRRGNRGSCCVFSHQLLCQWSIFAAVSAERASDCGLCTLPLANKIPENTARALLPPVTLLSPRKKHVPPRNVTNGAEATVLLAVRLEQIVFFFRGRTNLSKSGVDCGSCNHLNWPPFLIIRRGSIQLRSKREDSDGLISPPCKVATICDENGFVPMAPTRSHWGKRTYYI